jgi:hypothetical protein
MNSRINIGIVVLGMIILSSFLGCDHPLESEVLKSVIETIAEDQPDMPTDLQAAAISWSQIKLDWTDNSDNETEFQIQRKKAGSSGWLTLGSVGADSTTYPDDGLEAETEYTYRVRAVNDAGESEWSAEASATTVPIPLSPPDAPSDLTATVQNADQISLSWSDNSDNEEQFVIYRRKESGSFAELSVLLPNTTGYIDSGLDSETQYSYYVFARNAAGDSGISNTPTATTDSLPQPSGMNAVTAGNRQVDLTWIYDSPFESGFNLQRKTGSGSFVDLVTLGADTISYSDTTAVPGTQYIYRVRAYDGGGSSEWSNEAGAVTKIYAYLALYSGQIAIIEISDPQNPGAPVYRSTGWNPNTIEIHDSHIYVPILRDMAIIDVTDPTDPGSPAYIGDDYADDTFFVRYVALKQNYAYLTLEPWYLLIFNIATPSSPSFISQKSYGPPASASDIAIYGNYLYLPASSGLSIFDITNGASPTGPTYLDTIKTTKICIDGSRAYMTLFNSAALGVYSLASPSNPSFLGVRQFVGTAQDIAAQGDYVFMACGDLGLIVVDVSDMSDIDPPASVQADTNNAYGVAIIDNYALIADGGGGLAIIDISIPMSPGTPTYITAYGDVRDVTIDPRQ